MNNKPTLYDVAVEGALIADILTENDGELTPELEARLDALMATGPDKVEAAAMVLRNIEADAAVCVAEAARLTERAKGYERQAQRLKERMAAAVDMAFGGKVKTARFTIWTQKSADTIAIDLREEFTLEMFEQDLPEGVHTKKELNKQALREMFQAGMELPECVFVEEVPGKRYLRLK